MAYSVFSVTQLPDQPLDAAATFHGDIAHSIRQDLKNTAEQLDRVILFAPASHEHDGWRLAAVQELAREAAPARVNAIVGKTPDAANAIEQVMDYLDIAAGVTGQILQVHGNLTQDH